MGMWPVGQNSSCTATVTVEILQHPTSAGGKLCVMASDSGAHK